MSALSQYVDFYNYNALILPFGFFVLTLEHFALTINFSAFYLIAVFDH